MVNGQKIIFWVVAIVCTMMALFGCSDNRSKKETQSKEAISTKAQQTTVTQEVIKKNLTQFADLLNAAKCYLHKGLDIKELYPLSAENAGCLDKNYGGYKRPAPNHNWTAQGGWLGMWGNPDLIGVGIVGTFEEITPILEKYKNNAKEIFFPYPTRYNVNQKIDPNTKGQLLMIFGKRFVVSGE